MAGDHTGKRLISKSLFSDSTKSKLQFLVEVSIGMTTCFHKGDEYWRCIFGAELIVFMYVKPYLRISSLVPYKHMNTIFFTHLEGFKPIKILEK